MSNAEQLQHNLKEAKEKRKKAQKKGNVKDQSINQESFSFEDKAYKFHQYECLTDQKLLSTFQEKHNEDEIFCRYCYCDDVSIENPLLIMCQCKGSSGIVHYECWKSYLKTKMKVLGDKVNVVTLYWKEFQCEICSYGLPLYVEINGKFESLYDYDEVVQNFVD